jgi:uncharacterized protein with GYD domain
MAKDVTCFTYTSETWAKMIQDPGDRTAMIERLAASLGGSIECMSWMFSTHDGFVIAGVPDTVSAATLSVIVGSTGPLRTWSHTKCSPKSSSARHCHGPGKPHVPTRHPASRDSESLSSTLPMQRSACHRT